MNTARDLGINWTHYLDYTVDGHDITIIRSYSLHNERTIDHPDTDLSFRFVENNRRDVMAVKFSSGMVYALTTPISVYDLPA